MQHKNNQWLNHNHNNSLMNNNSKCSNQSKHNRKILNINILNSLRTSMMPTSRNMKTLIGRYQITY